MTEAIKRGDRVRLKAGSRVARVVKVYGKTSVCAGMVEVKPPLKLYKNWSASELKVLPPLRELRKE